MVPNPNTRPIGTATRNAERDVEQSIRELGISGRHLDFTNIINPSSSSSSSQAPSSAHPQQPQCCFMITESKRCTRTATHIDSRTNTVMWCWQHDKICKGRMRGYRVSCKKSQTRGDQMYRAADKLVKIFFGSPIRAQRFIVENEARVPRAHGGRRQPLGLTDMESVIQPLMIKYNSLTIQKRNTARELSREFYDDWHTCWHGRKQYRNGCEACAQDPGHVIAYYIFKGATMVAHTLRHHATE